MTELELGPAPVLVVGVLQELSLVLERVPVVLVVVV